MSKVLVTLLFFSLSFLLLDLYFWQAVKSNFLFNFKDNQVAKSVYWLISVLTLSMAIFSMYHYQNPEYSKQLILVRAFVLIVYMAKFFACFPLIIDDIIRGFKWIITLFNNFQSNSTPILPGGISRLDFLRNLK